jgi:hypothetical protein
MSIFDSNQWMNSIDNIPISTPQKNIMSEYNRIGNQFVKSWCDTLSSNIKNISKYCLPETLFTFFGSEIVGCDKLLTEIKNNNIDKILMIPDKISSQPSGSQGLHIVVFGKLNIITTNLFSKVMEKQFVSYFCLTRVPDKNTLYVNNHLIMTL